jgi:hypothetical protein
MSKTPDLLDIAEAPPCLLTKGSTTIAIYKILCQMANTGVGISSE